MRTKLTKLIKDIKKVNYILEEVLEFPRSNTEFVK